MNVFNSAKAGSGKVFKAGNAKLTVGGRVLFAINAQLSFQRNVSPLPTLGKGTHLVVGEPTGTFTASAILAKDRSAFKAFHMEGDGCDPFEMTIVFENSGCEDGGATYSAGNCVASQFSVTVQAGQGVVAENFSTMFTKLDVS